MVSLHLSERVRHFRALAVAVALFSVSGCQSDGQVAGFTPPTANELIQGLTLSPTSATLAPGQSVTFKPLGWYASGGDPIIASVTWSATGGTITSGGVYTAGSVPGTYQVKAQSTTTWNNEVAPITISGTTATINSIVLSPASATVPVGATKQFSVTASLSNGTTQSNPSGITWTATGGTISSTGLFKAGPTLGIFKVIAASANGKKDTSAVTVSSPVITSVSLTPSSVSLAKGAKQQFSVYAVFSNGGSQTMPNGLSWTATGGTITSGGYYTAGSTAGTFRVIVSSSNGIKDTSTVTVGSSTATVTGIVVTPGTASIGTGAGQQFSASAKLSDGTTKSASVTWSASGGTISSSGLYTAGSTAGTYRVIAVQSGGSLADTSAISVTSTTTSSGGTGLYPNKPSGYTQSTSIDFSQAVPPLPDNVDRSISGAPGWYMIYFGSHWSQKSDASATQSAPAVWNGNWPAGSYGGGIIGQGSGHGIGNIFTYAAKGTTRLYMSSRVYFDFDASQWHPISNKFINIEGNNSLLLVQLNEGGYWRHAEELSNSGTSFWVDNLPSSPGELHLPGQVNNTAVPTRKWVQIEVLIDLPNHIFKIWQDGVLTTNATPNFSSTVMNTISWNAFRGGGGETLSTALNWRYDHFYIAW